MNSTPRSPILDKDIKLLWGRSGNLCSRCRRQLDYEDRSSKYEYVILGEQSHIEGHSPNSARSNTSLTAKQKMSYDNLILLCLSCHKIIDEQNDVYSRNTLISLKNVHERWVKETLSKAVTIPSIIYKPIIAIVRTYGCTSGPMETTKQVNIKNISHDYALDCRIFYRGFGYEKQIDSHIPPFMLGPNEDKKLEVKISDEEFFIRKIQDLTLNVNYTNAEGYRFITKIYLDQFKKGNLNNFDYKHGDFIQPIISQDQDLTIKYIGEGSRRDGATGIFSIILNNISEKIEIGVSGTLGAVLGFNEKEKLFALKELAERKIKQMLRIGDIRDYIFTSDDLPQNINLHNYDLYKYFRDSII